MHASPGRILSAMDTGSERIYSVSRGYAVF
jgi:hypothetical protein